MIYRHQWTRGGGLLGVVALAFALATLMFVLVLFPSRSASALALPAPKADYRFQNTRATSVGTAPALTDIGPGTNTFATATVDGTSRRVLRFPQDNGVSLSPTTNVVSSGTYTIVALFELDTDDTWRRILDFKNGVGEEGLYFDDTNKLHFYKGTTVTGSVGSTQVPENTWVQVVLTRDSSGTVVGYVDGVQQFSFSDTSNLAVIDSNNALRFFKDNNAGTCCPNEESAGSVARIRLYDVALTAPEVGALDRLEPTNFVVNSTLDTSDNNTSDGKCFTGLTGAGGEQCTLRAAIEQAKATSGRDTIKFNIPASLCNPTTKVCTITPNSGLPPILEAVTIDGYTQGDGTPGTTADDATENTLANGTNAALKIELSGASTLSGHDGLVIFTSNVTVRGLIINRWQRIGVYIPQGSGIQVVGNFIGTDATGTQDLGNGWGVMMDSGNSSTVANNTVGGTTPASRNLISGNDSDGVNIRIDPSLATGNKVQGNLIGTKATGTGVLGNSGYGVNIFAASNTTVGGATAARNVISANSEGGVAVQGDLEHPAATRNRILFNSIFNNGGLGIDLSATAANGVTTNDTRDPDTGGNNLQNFPVMSSARTSGTSTTIRGTLNSTPNKDFTIQFFSTPAVDPTGFGEGNRYLGQTTVHTDALGNASFTFTETPAVPVGQAVTATATDTLGNTSEFSRARGVVAG